MNDLNGLRRGSWRSRWAAAVVASMLALGGAACDAEVDGRDDDEGGLDDDEERATVTPAVSSPKIDADHAVLSAETRTYPGLPAPVEVTDLHEINDANTTSWVFEHQVQGASVDGTVLPSLTFSPGPGGRALRFFVPASDEKARSELWFEGSRRPGVTGWEDPTHSERIPWDQTRWTAFNLWLGRAPGGDVSRIGNGIIMQWWQFSPGNPPMGVTYTVKQGKPSLMVRVDGDPANGPGHELFWVRYPIEPDDLGAWFDVALKYRLSRDPEEGFVEVWFKRHGESQWRPAYDDLAGGAELEPGEVESGPIPIGFTLEQKIALKDNPQVADDSGLAHKFGIYRPWANPENSTSVVFDNVRNGPRWSNVRQILEW